MNYLGFKFNTSIAFASSFLLLSILSGCSSSSDTNDTAASKDEGDLYISLTDAQGDFSQYRVDVTGLKLYRSNGSVIETLPNTTTIDFAQYVDVTEFLSASSVPVGVYTKAEITLDYSSAKLSVENAAGDSIPATAVDSNNTPLTQVTLTTFINANQGFIITKGQPASLTIDFDLESSNEVTIAPSGQSATVTVNPVLIANTTFDDQKERRLRGLLASVDTTTSSYIVNIRPFQVRNRHFGELVVSTDDTTVFEVNGEQFDASLGLAALANLDSTAAIVTIGIFDFDQKRFIAQEVFAGTSVPWDNKDVVKGSIIARNANSLTVLGATIELDNGQFTFNDNVVVTIDADTKVTKQGTTENVNINNLSIGQRVVIIGNVLSDGSVDATTAAGLVRMRYSDISGTIALVSPLQINLQHINRRQINNYTFTGTGIDALNDADPSSYEVATSTLSLSNLNNGSAIKVRGFPTAFATAPEDFTAKSIMDISLVNTKMFISYGFNGSATALVSLDDNGLQLDISSSTGRHYLNQFGVITDLSSLASVPVITANDGGRTLYTISLGKTLNVFTTWSDFQAALNTQLANGNVISLVHSNGQYDATTLSFSSRQIVIRLVSSS